MEQTMEQTTYIYLPKPKLIRLSNDSNYELDCLSAPSSEILYDSPMLASYYTVKDVEYKEPCHPSYLQNRKKESKPCWSFCVYW